MKKALFALFAAGAAMSAAVPAAPVLAQSAGSAALSPTERALVQRANGYLGGLTSARGRFQQTDANGRVTTGTFYLKRPGRIRFEYDAPSRLLVVADGTNVKIYDQRLRTFDQYPLSRTPLSVFLNRSIDLNRYAVSNVTRSGNGFSFSARDARRQGQGYITLSFGENPVRLSEWTVVDAQRRRTRVRLLSLNPGPVSDSLFVLNNPTQRR